MSSIQALQVGRLGNASETPDRAVSVGLANRFAGLVACPTQPVAAEWSCVTRRCEALFSLTNKHIGGLPTPYLGITTRWGWMRNLGIITSPEPY